MSSAAPGSKGKGSVLQLCLASWVPTSCTGITNMLITFSKDVKLLWIIIRIPHSGFVHPLGNQE